MGKSNSSSSKSIRGNSCRLLSKLQFAMIAVFVVMVFNVSLLPDTSYAGSLLQSPAPAVTKPPQTPIQNLGTTPQDALRNCYTDRYGQIHCSGSGTSSTPAGPLGAACKTSSGANGIWVVTSSASNMVCATTGDTCWTGSGGMGKVWGTGSTMVCGGKGDYCPSSTGAGRVFDIGGSVVCLGLGNYCTRTLEGSPCTGCKVVGAPGNYLTFECAKKFVSCPAPAQASIQMAPTNGQAGGPIQVSLLTSNPRYDSSTVYCDYYVNDKGKQIGYSIPCRGAYSTTNPRYRACTKPDNTVEKQVACDVPGRANGIVNSSALSRMGSDMSIMNSLVTATFLGSANDAARENALCTYRIDGFAFMTRIPCNSPKKAVSGGPNAYWCY